MCRLRHCISPRTWLASTAPAPRGIRVTIPRKRDEWRRGRVDKQLYKLRARVEQLITA